MDVPGSANSMINRDTMTDKEVLATLSGSQHRESQRTFYFEVLRSDISNHLLSNIPQDIKAKGTNPSFTWSTTGTGTVHPQLKLRTASFGRSPSGFL